MPKTKSPTLNGLRGAHTLDDNTRAQLRIQEGILVGEVSNWRDEKLLVADYFKHTTSPQRNWRDAHETLVSSLSTVRDMEASKKMDLLLKRYAGKVVNYVKMDNVKVQFGIEYNRLLLHHDLITTRQNATIQGRITGNKLSQLGAVAFSNEVDELLASNDFSTKPASGPPSKSPSPSEDRHPPESPSRFEDESSPKSSFAAVDDPFTSEPLPMVKELISITLCLQTDTSFLLNRPTVR